MSTVQNALPVQDSGRFAVHRGGHLPPRKKSTPKPTRRWVNITDAALEIDLSVRQLQKYAVLPGCPRKSNGKGAWVYEWPAFNRFVRETLAREAAEAMKPGDTEEAKGRKLAAEAELAELELARERGHLVEVSRYDRAIDRAFGRVRSRLISLPVRASPDMVGLEDELEAERRLDRYMLEVMAELRTEGVPDDDELEDAA